MDQDGLHEIDLRIKCCLVVIKHVLVQLFQYSISQHKDCKTKTNYNIGFAEILAANQKNLSKISIFSRGCNKEHFYDKLISGSSIIYQLKKSVNLDELDFSVICLLLRSRSFSFIMTDKCCKSCAHDCVLCGTICEENVGCKYKPCSNCHMTTQKCDYLNFIIFVIIAKFLRNTNAHTTQETYQKFEKGVIVLPYFQTCKTWEDIWHIVNNTTSKCLNILFINGKIDNEILKDKEMELRVALRRSKDCLIPIVGKYIKESHDKIIKQDEVIHKLEKLDNNFVFAMKSIYMSISFGIIGAVIILLCGIYMFQLYIPGSAYRYYDCAKDRRIPHGSAFFRFVPYTSPQSYPEVSGIEFEFHIVTEKLNRTNYKRLNVNGIIEGARYYLNFDRCAYGQVINSDDPVSKRKAIRGPDMFAVDRNCHFAYYYDDALDTWRKYNTVNALERKNIRCNI